MNKLFNIVIFSSLLLTSACQRNNFTDSQNTSRVPYNAQKMPIGPDGCSETVARIRTAKGNIDFCFFPRTAPSITNRFSELVESGFYDGMTFHRVIPGQIVQTGDPSGIGSGGSNQPIRPERNNIPISRGSVVLAHDSITKSYDSQFYIALNSLPDASNRGVVFGQVVSGIDVLDELAQGDKLITLVLIDQNNAIK